MMTNSPQPANQYIQPCQERGGEHQGQPGYKSSSLKWLDGYLNFWANFKVSFSFKETKGSLREELISAAEKVSSLCFLSVASINYKLLELYFNRLLYPDASFSNKQKTTFITEVPLP